MHLKGLESSKSTPTETPLSHRKAASETPNQWHSLLILRLLNITLQHHVTDLHNLMPNSLFAMKLLAVLARAFWS